MSNHTDKELLELAAKAAGLKCKWFKVKKWAKVKTHGGSICKMHGGYNDVFGTHHKKPWNPLTDDGDALRLAVKMRLKVDIRAACITVEPYIFNQNAETTFEFFADDDSLRSVATRRAIVRAAAAIGEGL